METSEPLFKKLQTVAHWSVYQHISLRASAIGRKQTLR